MPGVFMQFKARVVAVLYTYRPTDGKKVIVVNLANEDDIPMAEREEDATRRNLVQFDLKTPNFQLGSIQERRGQILFEESEWDEVKELFVVNKLVIFGLARDGITINNLEGG